MAGAGPEIIDLCSSDDEQAGASATSSVPKRPRRVSASPTRSAGAVPPPPASDDDEIEIVHVKHGSRGKGIDEEAVASGEGASKSPEFDGERESDGDDDNDEDLVVVNQTNGVRANVDYPHLRFSCGVHPFGRSARANRLHCVKCYCYVCDDRASNCTQWSSHCAATDKQARWRTARTKARNKSSSVQSTRKKTSRDYFVRRGASRNNSSYATTASSVAIRSAESVRARAATARVRAAAARDAATRVHAVSAPSFQESVLAIIGEQPDLTAASLSAHRHHPAQVAGALDALDAALSLRWPIPGVPQVAPLDLTPLGGIVSQAPRSAPSHRTAPLPSPSSVMAPISAPLPSPSSVMAPISAPSTPAPNSTLLSRIPVPLPQLPELAPAPAPAQAPALSQAQSVSQAATNNASNQAAAEPDRERTSPFPSPALLEPIADKARARIRPAFEAGPRLLPLAPAPVPILAHVPPPVEPAAGPVSSSDDTSAPVDPTRSPRVLSPQPMQGVSRPLEPPKEVTLQRRDVSSPASSENSADSVAAAESIRLRAQAAALDPLSTLITAGLGLGEPDGSTSAS